MNLEALFLYLTAVGLAGALLFLSTRVVRFFQSDARKAAKGRDWVTFITWVGAALLAIYVVTAIPIGYAIT